MQHFLAFLRLCAHDRMGVAAVEFAIIAPVLITLLGAAVDLGTAIDSSIRLENAARTGAQYVTRAPNDIADAQIAAMATLSGWSDVTITVGPMVCQCPLVGAAVGGVFVGCNTPCDTGMVRYITTTAARPFEPIFPTSGFIPFNSIGVSTSSVVARIQ